MRAEAGFAKPEIDAWGEQERIIHTTGLVPNAWLEALVHLPETRWRMAYEDVMVGTRMPCPYKHRSIAAS